MAGVDTGAGRSGSFGDRAAARGLGRHQWADQERAWVESEKEKAQH